MPNADFFKPFGLYVQQNFLSTELCESICNELEQGKTHEATVTRQGMELVDETVRSTKSAALSSLSAEIKEACKAKFDSLSAKLSEHFKESLSEYEALNFLIYQKGGFFLPHTDGSHDEDAADYAKQRKVSVVVFLNDSYEGGELTFYGLFKEEGWKEKGFGLKSERGLLIAFPPDMLHEVKPVQSGMRYTLVTWFF